MTQAVWVEIPVHNLERALKFYQTVFNLPPTEILSDDVRQTSTIVSMSETVGVGVSLNQTANFEPNNKGVLVYLDAGEDLSDHLSRIEPAGGKVIEAKTSMGSAGMYATFQDTEGNVLALYSIK